VFQNNAQFPEFGAKVVPSNHTFVISDHSLSYAEISQCQSTWFQHDRTGLL